MPQKVLVYGDVMLDVYVTGSIKRDSPEAPGVHVLSETVMSEAPGGAANVATNIAALGGQAMLLGVVGADASATLLEMALADKGVSLELLMRATGRTTSKTRFIADGKHVLRVDMESQDWLSPADERQLCARLSALVPQSQAVVISDYAKGAVTPAVAKWTIKQAAKHGVPVIVDAKKPAAQCFQGATVIKPNLKEIAAALGVKDQPATQDEVIEAAVQLLRKSKGTQYILLTRGDEGMCLVRHDKAMILPAHPVQVVDVTGAGDAVAAALALALANGEDIIDAVHLANAAAAVVVTKSGTARPTPEEVLFFYDRVSGRDRPARQPVAAQGAANWLH